MKQCIFLAGIVLWLSSAQLFGQTDCNANNIADAAEIAAGTAQDCNNNGIPDSCDIAASLALISGQSIPVGAVPLSLTSADIDSNGTTDLIMANRTPNTVTILRNNGTGSFQTSNVAVGTNPESVVAVDLNGDANPDLATANAGSNNVSVLLNIGQDANGVPLFGPVVNVAVGTNPTFIAALDLDDDGDTDLATANLHSNNITKLLNDGDGVFTSGGNVTVGVGPVAIAAADFDGDGTADLAVANFSSNNLSVLLSGGTSPPPTQANFGQPFSLTAGDFDGDSDNDLVVANFDASTVLLLRNDGTGSLIPGGEITQVVNPSFVTSGDFDGDGDRDLIVSEADKVLAFNNTGNGTFLLVKAGTIGAGINSLVVTQLNGAGGPDIAAANEALDTILILQDQTQTPAAPDCDGNGVPDGCQADTDGDGTIDACDTTTPPPDDIPPPDDNPPPAAPQCGTGACGAGAATMAPLMLMGMGWMRPVFRRGQRRQRASR